MTFLILYISCSNSGVDRNQDIANKIDSLQTVDSLNNSIISDFRDKVRIDSAIVAELEYQIKGYEEITKILKNIVNSVDPVSYTHLRAHETDSYLVCRLLLEKIRLASSHPQQP